MIGAFVAFVVVTVNRMPQTIASALLATGFIGFTMIPASGTIEWFHMPGGNPEWTATGTTLLGLAVLVSGIVYWFYLALSSLTTPIDHLSTLTDGLFLSFLGLFVYFYIGIKRQREGNR
jgi:hypothetical protein